MGTPIVEIYVSNFDQAKRAIAMANDRGTYRGMFRDEITLRLREGRDYATQITHRQTGSLAESHTYEYDSHRMRGSIYINPESFWLQSETKIRQPAEYGIYEHARGGTHAFYERTSKEYFGDRTRFVYGLARRVKELPWP